jgi:polyphenol oxidase
MGSVNHIKQIIKGRLQLWQFACLEEREELRHFVSDRNSLPGGPEFTLSYSSTPDAETVRSNRNLLAAAMELAPEALFFPSQVHGTGIVAVNRQTPKEALAQTDALITREKGIGIAVLSADCVPVLLYDKRRRAIGAVHAGWRGTAARILEKTLLAMQEQYGSQGEDLIACIGPSVCQESYEVGQEVIESIQQAFPTSSELLIDQPNRKAKLDLWKANRLQLLEFGVPPGQIETANLCTLQHNKHFFSARKGDTGRFAAGILLV